MARQLIPDEAASAVMKEFSGQAGAQPEGNNNSTALCGEAEIDLEPVCEKHISFEEARTPILRKKSSDENPIVSILKKNNPESG